MTISWDAVNWGLSFVLSLGLLFPIAGSVLLFFERKAKDNEGSISRKNALRHAGICLFGILLILGVQIIPAIGPWEEMRQGIYESAEYTDTTRQTSHGSIHTYHKTIVHFSDGQSVVLIGKYAVEFPKGTKLKVLTKNNYFKILKAD